MQILPGPVDVNLPNTSTSAGTWYHQLCPYIFDLPSLFLGGLGAHVSASVSNKCTTISNNIASLFQRGLGANVSLGRLTGRVALARPRSWAWPDEASQSQGREPADLDSRCAGFLPRAPQRPRSPQLRGHPAGGQEATISNNIASLFQRGLGANVSHLIKEPPE